MKLLPVNLIKNTLHFGEIDEGNSDSKFYNHQTLEAKLEKSIKKERIEEEYRQLLSELASWADDDEMSTAAFWREYRILEAAKNNEIRKLDLYY